MLKRLLLIACFLSVTQIVGLAQANTSPQIDVLVEGLLNPVGMALLPNGNLLIAEEGTGDDDLSAGVSMMLSDGTVGRLISGFPSSRDAGDLSGVPLVNVAPDGNTIYIGNFNAGHLWTLDANQAETLPETPFTPDDLGIAMERLNNVRLINPFDMTFDAEGIPVVSDATGNGVAKENNNGTTRFIHRFDNLVDPARESNIIEPVPTGITRVEDEYYVALLGGCPYPANSGEIVAIDENRNQRTVIDNLNLPIDVAQADDGRLWVLEFAQFTPDASCFTGMGYRPETGRLSYYEVGELTPVLENLDFPGSVLPLADGSVYVTQIFSGEILHITFEDTTWHFTDVAADLGIDFEHGAFVTTIFSDPVAMMGAGVCWIDYDNDGWLDLYLVNSHAKAEYDYLRENAGLPQNALYRNQAGRFTDVSETTQTNLAMRGNGCVVADFNNDGWDDIFITAEGDNTLLLNNADNRFTEVGAIAGINTPEWNSAAAVADLNGDGWLDLFVGSYLDFQNLVPNPVGAFPQDYYGIPDHLYLNNGIDEQGIPTFTEITREVGLSIDERTLGALFSDLDNDGDLDLYIANDGQPNRLYQYEIADNPYGFTFVDTYDTSGVNDRGSGMGVTSGDWTGDGWADLMVTNWDSELNAIYSNDAINSGQLSFTYRTYRIGMLGLGNNMTGWGVHFADFDNDTDLDLMTVNGRVPIIDLEADAELVRLYGNRLVEGHAGEFREWTDSVGLSTVGHLMARGSAAADFDNDGDLDVAINTIAGSAVLLRNQHPTGNWLTVDLNSILPGTRVAITLADGTQLQREVHTGSSYLASEDPRLHFGLGTYESIQQVTITYMNGDVQTYENVAVNQILIVN